MVGHSRPPPMNTIIEILGNDNLDGRTGDIHWAWVACICITVNAVVVCITLEGDNLNGPNPQFIG